MMWQTRTWYTPLESLQTVRTLCSSFCQHRCLARCNGGRISAHSCCRGCSGLNWQGGRYSRFRRTSSWIKSECFALCKTLAGFLILYAGTSCLLDLSRSWKWMWRGLCRSPSHLQETVVMCTQIEMRDRSLRELRTNLSRRHSKELKTCCLQGQRKRWRRLKERWLEKMSSKWLLVWH